MSSTEPEDCRRHRVDMDGFHFYFILGENFIQVFPDGENRPENLRERMVLDAFCGAATQVMGGSNE